MLWAVWIWHKVHWKTIWFKSAPQQLSHCCAWQNCKQSSHVYFRPFSYIYIYIYIYIYYIYNIYIYIYIYFLYHDIPLFSMTRDVATWKQCITRSIVNVCKIFLQALYIACQFKTLYCQKPSLPIDHYRNNCISLSFQV